jgi:hypothetical protein
VQGRGLGISENAPLTSVRKEVGTDGNVLGRTLCISAGILDRYISQKYPELTCSALVV